MQRLLLQYRWSHYGAWCVVRYQSTTYHVTSIQTRVLNVTRPSSPTRRGAGIPPPPPPSMNSDIREQLHKLYQFSWSNVPERMKHRI